MAVKTPVQLTGFGIPQNERCVSMFPYCMCFCFYFVYLLNVICYPAIYFEKSLLFSFCYTSSVLLLSNKVMSEQNVLFFCGFFLRCRKYNEMLKLTRIFIIRLYFIIGIYVFSCNLSHSIISHDFICFI